MADIAFLLLIFFLVTTTITIDKGVPFILPPKPPKDQKPIEIADRNLFRVVLNSQNQLLVEDEVMSIGKLRGEAKRFLSNQGRNATLSESYQKAVVSFKVDRGSEFQYYLQVLDELKGAYHELRAEYLGISLEAYLELDDEVPEDKEELSKAQKEIPMQLSEAEPIDFGS